MFVAGTNEPHETRVSTNRLRPLSVLMTGRCSVDWLTMALAALGQSMPVAMWML